MMKNRFKKGILSLVAALMLLLLPVFSLVWCYTVVRMW